MSRLSHNREYFRRAAAIALLLLGGLAHAQIDCNMFWAGGIPIAGHPGGAVWCESYLPGDDADSVVIGGYEYRILVDASLDPEDLQPQLSWLAEAIDDAVVEYSLLGDDVKFYVYVSPDYHPSDTAQSVWAAAIRDYRDGEPCPIFFYPIGMEQRYEDFKQTVAHEAFHCVQQKTYWGQVSGSTANRWWVEGTAVYFSNVVYPDFNYEWKPSADFNPDLSLLDLVYSSNFFFQDLANRVGEEGIIRLIASMPGVDGQAAQQNALSGFPNMQDHWHQFGQNYLDKDVNDTGLLTVDVDPDTGERVTIEGDHTESFDVTPFQMHRRTFWFAPGHSFRVNVETLEGAGIQSAKELEAGGAWGPVPDLIVTDCDVPREYQFLATSASPTTEPINVLALEIEVLPSCGCEKPPHPFDQCVVGTWEMDLDSLDNTIEGLRDGRVQTLPSDGHHRLTITDYGVALGEHQITHTSVFEIPPAGRQELRHTRTGTYKSRVQNASKSKLMFCSVESDFRSAATMNGVPMELGPLTQFQQSPDPVFTDVEDYECSKFQLKLWRRLPNGLLRDYQFNRVFDP